MTDIFTYFLLVADATVRMATPLILAALAGLCSERAAVIDIGLEGKMLGGAFVAGAVSYLTGSVWLGLVCAVVACLLLALLHGFACITHRGNQVVSGMAINIVVAGLAPTLGHAIFHINGDTPSLPMASRFMSITLPGAEMLHGVPVIGPIYYELISGHNLLTYVAFAMIPLVSWMLYKTRFGLRLRAVGENPEAVDTAGISVEWLRYRAVLIAGALCGLAGASLSTALGASFIRDMTAGKGYLALAAMIFGKWKPGLTVTACLLFAFCDALQARLQGVELPLVGEVPVQFIIMLPYVMTVILLAGFVGKVVAPKADGIPYVKER
ncbi:ABC transporter permease [Pseudodesulfovibrio sediminis]|uniref:ABC transporter permease n=1 Tax=Pseudodesulfovibrio sediminis TaxID=2810563 RepID=A0ABN6EVD2_9BACT|nr:ABC transporter permease [Pseudodesulfovibrio sediminis]BCS89144.1 ABC transporter permease [Pseudodesulfovibrio sediminis]